MHRASWPALILAVIFVALLATVATNFDFRAFYCAGTIVRSGGNPYTVEPLHACERALAHDPFTPFSAATALPAPLPAYALAAFVPFSYLPFAVAALAWTLLLCLAGLIAMMCTVRITALPATLVAAALLLSLFAASLGLGETVPLFVAALCVAAAFAVRNRWQAAAIATAAAMIEPHLGIPVAISLFLWAPGSRFTLGICAAAFAALSIALLGVHGNLEYLTRVLPEHAVSELGSDAQLSLTVILYGLGAAPHVAILLGTIAYVLACAAGIYAARVLARELESPAFIVVTPAAFAVMGGTFIHVTQMAAALPFALLLWSRAPRYRAAIAVSCALLAIPWRVTGSPLLMIAAVFATSTFACHASQQRIWIAAASGAAAAVLLAVLNFALTAPPMHARPHPSYSALLDPRYAEASWAAYNDRYLSTGSPERWARRVPTWAGLLLLAGSASLLCVSEARLHAGKRTARVQHAS